MNWHLWIPKSLTALALGSLLGFVSVPLTAEDADRVALAVDALTRLEGVNLEANAVMKERVLKVLEKTRGTPNFVRLVRHFQLPNQEAGLLDVAVAAPRDENGVEAIRLVLASGKTEGLGKILSGPDPAASNLAEVLGNSGHKEAVPFLQQVLELDVDRLALKKQAVRSLVRIHEGARALVSLASTNKLPEDLRELTVAELRKTRWEDIKSEVTRIASRTPVLSGAALPSMAELLQAKGDIERGQAIYHRSSPGCIACHVVRGQGTELGPNLSEIGSKLGKDALYQAILEPSAGISFGYEAFTVTTRDGEEAYGLIASETAEELVLKGVGGITTRLKKTEIVERRKSTLSIMPAGLEVGMKAQELVDLVEYLASLKKAN